MKALTYSRFGGPEVLEYIDVPDPAAAPGCAIVETHAIGLNFADVYRRQGNYVQKGSPPYIAGYEAAGVIASATEGCPFAVGARVGFADSPFANAEKVSVPFDKLIALPEYISFDQAAALLLQGLTAQYLLRDSHHLQAGETILVHAAAGGVGLLLVQLARAKSAHVIGVTSSPVKAVVARGAGAEHVLLYSQDWVQKAYALGFEASGMDVVYDSVGTTLMDSIRAARIGGHVVFYGFAAGNPPLIDPRILMDESKSLTGGDLWNVLDSAETRRTRASQLFNAIRIGAVHLQIAARIPLAKGAEAHALLESRMTSGKVLLIP